MPSMALNVSIPAGGKSLSALLQATGVKFVSAYPDQDGPSPNSTKHHLSPGPAGTVKSVMIRLTTIPYILAGALLFPPMYCTHVPCPIPDAASCVGRAGLVIHTLDNDMMVLAARIAIEFVIV